MLNEINCLFFYVTKKNEKNCQVFLSLIDGGRPIWNELIIHYINVMALD